MTTIRFRCANGHKLKANQDMAGRKGRCPKCQTRFRVPRAQKKVRSDSSIADFLGYAQLPPLEPVDEVAEEVEQAGRLCPQCGSDLDEQAHFCTHCHTYVLPESLE